MPSLNPIGDLADCEERANMTLMEDAMTEAESARMQQMQSDVGIESFDPSDHPSTLETEKEFLDERFSDPDFEAYATQMVQEALDDPRPPVPIEEVRKRLDRKYAEARKTYGQ